MKTLFSIIFVLPLSLITLHDAHSMAANLQGYNKSIAFGINKAVVAVRTTDGELFNVRNLGSSAKQLKEKPIILTDDGKGLVFSEINTYFYTGKTKSPTISKHPVIGY